MMDNQTNLLDLFNKYGRLFNFYYEQKNLIPDNQDIGNEEIPDLLINLKKSLDNIDFGKISYSNKLIYLFTQYLIKEIEITNNINKSDQVNIFQKQFFLGFNFPDSLIRDLCSNNIITSPYDEIDKIFSKFENSLKIIGLSKNNLNLFQLKSFYSFINDAIELLIEVSDKIGGIITPEEKNKITIKTKFITSLLNGYQKNLIRKLMSDNNFKFIYDFKIINNIFEINKYDFGVEKIIEMLQAFKINCSNSLNSLINSNNNDKSIQNLYSDIGSKKLMSFESKKNIIEDEITKIQNWLKEKNLLSDLEFFPLKIQKTDQRQVDWIHDPVIEFIHKNNNIKGLKILLMDESNREIDKGLPLGEWELKNWVIDKLIPGELYLNKIFPISNKTNYLTIKRQFGQQRWNLLFKFIFLKYGYYSDSENQFLALFHIYYNTLLIIGVLDLFIGKNYNDICKNIHNLTGVDLIKCSYDLFNKHNNFSYKLIEIIDCLYLLQILTKLEVDLLPQQRFFDILGKNINFPYYILKQIYEKYFNIIFKIENNEEISKIFQN